MPLSRFTGSKLFAKALGALLCALLPTVALAHPGSGIVVDRAGNVYFLDTGSGLWKIDTKGVLTKITAPRFHWLALDEADRFARGARAPNSGGETTPVGTSPTLLVASDNPILIGSGGDLFYPSHYVGTWVDLMRVAPGGNAAAIGRAQLPWLNGLTAAPNGDLYYTGNAGVWRMSLQGRVTPVATNVELGQCATIPGNEAESGPFLRGLAVDASGNVFVAASGCGRVIRIAPSGEVTTIVQTTAPWSPTAVALHGADLYVLEYLHTVVEDRLAWIPRVRKVTPDGKSSIIATVTR